MTGYLAGTGHYRTSVTSIITACRLISSNQRMLSRQWHFASPLKQNSRRSNSQLGQMSSFSMDCWTVPICCLICDPSFDTTEHATTGRDTPHARPRADTHTRALVSQWSRHLMQHCRQHKLYQNSVASVPQNITYAWPAPSYLFIYYCA